MWETGQIIDGIPVGTILPQEKIGRVNRQRVFQCDAFQQIHLIILGFGRLTEAWVGKAEKGSEKGDGPCRGNRERSYFQSRPSKVRLTVCVPPSAACQRQA